MKSKKPLSCLALIAGLALFASTPPGHARVLDNFNDNVKTDWEDFVFGPGLGKSIEAGGKLRFEVPAIGQPIFTATTKKSEVLRVQDGRTIELRLDILTASDKDSFTVLSWTPASARVADLAGYSIAKSPTDILITKGINKYFYSENPTPALKNDNVTLVLKVTGSGPNVVITGQVLDKDDNNRVIFEQTFTDTPGADILSDGTDSPAAPYMGDGYYTIIGYADYAAGGPNPYVMEVDNAELFVYERTLLDDFNSGKNDWRDFTFGVGSSVVSNGKFVFRIPPAGQPLFFASTKTSRTFDLVDGARMEFQVDLDSGNDKDSFAILSWIPTSQNVGNLAGYSLAKSTTDILITKGINKYFYAENPIPALKNDNVILSLMLERRGSSVTITGRVLDKDAGNAVIFEQSFLDTEAADILSDGTDSPPAPWTGSGNVVLMLYEDFAPGGPNPYEVVFDNLYAIAEPLAGNTPPIISVSSPAEFGNFLPATTPITFSVNDDKTIPNSGLHLLLNGTRIDTSNGLVVTASGNGKTATFTGLQAGRNYRVEIVATDSDNATTKAVAFFDTFATSAQVIEMEDYNYAFGQFFDNPPPLMYFGQPGYEGVDFHDTRAAGRFDGYRDGDPVAFKVTLDYPRKKFIDLGGPDAGYNDYDIGEIASGEWLNYTRTFAPGTYEVYLRQSYGNLERGEAVLEKVTSDPTQENQTTVVLGSFLGIKTGSRFMNVPLTDGTGANVARVQLNGQETLRLRQVTASPADGSIFQNYLVFVPASAGGVQRAAITSIAPANNSDSTGFTVVVRATIQNRDTSVATGSIALAINGQPVQANVQSNGLGAEVSHTLNPLPPAGTVVSAKLSFKDNQDVEQTYEWSFTVSYLSLNAANAQAGTGKDRGMSTRVVQAIAGGPALENSLARAEAQLAPNSTIPSFMNSLTTEQVINFTQNDLPSFDGYFEDAATVPGLNAAENGTDDIAMEVLTYLDLAGGVHRFGVRSDDGFKLTSGATPRDANGIVLGFRNGGTADMTFDFFVPKAGLYPFRLVWYERGGGAHVEWFSVNPANGERTLINDPSVATAIKAYTSVDAPPVVVTLESSGEAGSGFTPVAGATVNQSTGVITAATSGSTRFYRVRHSGPLAGGQLVRITALKVMGGTIEITYQVAPGNP